MAYLSVRFRLRRCRFSGLARLLWAELSYSGPESKKAPFGLCLWERWLPLGRLLSSSFRLMLARRALGWDLPLSSNEGCKEDDSGTGFAEESALAVESLAWTSDSGMPAVGLTVRRALTLGGGLASWLAISVAFIHD